MPDDSNGDQPPSNPPPPEPPSAAPPPPPDQQGVPPPPDRLTPEPPPPSGQPATPPPPAPQTPTSAQPTAAEPHGGQPGAPEIPSAPDQPAGSSGENQQAIWALVLGILSICLCGLIAGIPALILGYLGRQRALELPDRKGEGMALAGMILGGLSIVVSIVVIMVLFSTDTGTY